MEAFLRQYAAKDVTTGLAWCWACRAAGPTVVQDHRCCHWAKGTQDFLPEPIQPPGLAEEGWSQDFGDDVVVLVQRVEIGRSYATPLQKAFPGQPLQGLLRHVVMDPCGSG